jgi:hypothetical protein
MSEESLVRASWIIAALFFAALASMLAVPVFAFFGWL